MFLKIKNFELKIKNYAYQRGLASMVYKFLIKIPPVVLFRVKLCQTRNKLKNYKNQLLENLKDKRALNFYRHSLECSLADMKLISKFN